MYSVANLLDRAMKNGNIETHYRLAKVIGISQGAMGGYKSGKTMPDARVLEQLCALSGDDLAVVAAQIQAERERTPEARKVWLMIANRLAGGVTTAILSVVFGVLFSAVPLDSARAAAHSTAQNPQPNLLYIVLSAFSSVGQFLRVRLRRFALLLWSTLRPV